MKSKISQHSKLRLFLILSLLALVFTLVAQRIVRTPLLNSSKLTPHFAISPSLQEHVVTFPDLPNVNLSMVGIALIDDNTFFACNYRTIAIISAETGQENNRYTYQKIDPPAEIDIWEPTGLFYVPEEQALYVANYNGHNVLKFRYNPSQSSLSLLQEITHPDLISPENVFITESGEIIAADYDGNAVFKFSAEGDLKWKVEITQAHGVSATADTIYVSGLMDRTLSKISQDGKVLKTVGGKGIQVGKYAWPVGVTVLEDGSVMVVDAHNGRLTRLDSDLNVLEAVGANGPGKDLLNYPYAIAQTQTGDLWLADSFKARLLKLSDKGQPDQNVLGRNLTIGTELQSFFDYQGTGLQPVLNTSAINEPPEATTSPYTYPVFPGVDILRALGISNTRLTTTPHGGFNSIDYYDTNGVAQQELELESASSAFYAFDSQWYSTWAQAVNIPEWGSLIVIGTPQAFQTLIIDTVTGAWTRGEIDISSFPDKSTEGQTIIRKPNGEPLDLAEVVEPLLPQFQRLKSLIEAGQPRAQAFEAVFAQELDKMLTTRNKNVWEALLTTNTDSAKAFYKAYLEDPTAVEAAAKQYFTKRIPEPYGYLFECLAVNYLAGGSGFELP